MVITGCEEGVDLISGNGGDGRIVAQEGLELAEDVSVISDSVRGETASVCVEKVALKGLRECDWVVHF